MIQKLNPNPCLYIFNHFLYIFCMHCEWMGVIIMIPIHLCAFSIPITLLFNLITVLPRMHCMHCAYLPVNAPFLLLLRGKSSSKISTFFYHPSGDIFQADFIWFIFFGIGNCAPNVDLFFLGYTFVLHTIHCRNTRTSFCFLMKFCFVFVPLVESQWTQPNLIRFDFIFLVVYDWLQIIDWF